MQAECLPGPTTQDVQSCDSKTSSSTAQTWSHQPPAIDFMLRRPATLLDSWMGTGKTKMCIEVLRGCVRPGDLSMILCPQKVMGVWRGEFEKHAPGEFEVLALDQRSWNSVKKAQVIAEAIKRCSSLGRRLVIVVNYETFILPAVHTVLGINVKVYQRQRNGQTVEEKRYDAVGPEGVGGRRLRWRCVIVDESHKIAAHDSQRSWLLFKLAPLCDKRVCSTGTPCANNPASIFGQYRFLDFTIYGQYWTKFLADWAVMNKQIPHKIDAWRRQEEFAQKLGTIRYHIPKSVLKLPDKQDITIPVQLSAKGMSHYNKMKSDAIVQLKQVIYENESSGQPAAVEMLAESIGQTAAVKWLRLLTLAQGYVRTTEREIITTCQEKRKALLELLEQTEEPVCVYGWFEEDMRIFREIAGLLDRRYGEVSGRCNDLTAAGKYPQDVQILGVQCASGGVGVDLTYSRIGIFFNSGMLSPGEYDQLLARQHRPGQTQNVVYYHLVSQGTIDQTVIRAREKKKKISEEILELALQQNDPF